MSNQASGEGELKRTLQTRHLNMIAIGGAIGTGLFFASGSAISQSGPGGALFAYAVMGLLVYFLMTSLGEMATMLPLSGSFEEYATRFVDPAFGFALGWNYWFSWSITVAAELVAGGLIIKYFFPNGDIFGPYSGTAWAMIFLVLLFGLNFMSARAYGEAEYWFAGIKVITIIVFLIVGILMILGIMGGEAPGFKNWTLLSEGRQAPFVGGIFAMLNVFLVAGFSFQGTELVGLAAGESANPEKDVPKAINTVFWRILLFYVGAITVIGFLIPFNDANLLQGSITNVAASPFTLVFAKAGFGIAAGLMNAVILTSVLSCGNSGLYASSRMLYAMAMSGKAPKFFTYVSKSGVPVYALIATALVASLAFFTSTIGEGKIYFIFYNASGLTGFFAWLGIAICHFRFRAAFTAQGRKLEDLKYTAKWYPFGPIFAIILSTIVIFGANIWVFQNDKSFLTNLFSFDGITNYGLIPIFLLMLFGYKFVKGTKLVPLKEADFSFEHEGHVHVDIDMHSK